MTNYGPKTAFADQLHAEKYRGEGEDFREAMTRIAGALSDGNDHFRQFRDIIGNQRFLPGGRIQSAVGAAHDVTPFNCFASGTIEDSMNGDGSIMDRLSQAAETMRMGGGIGYDFSTLRWNGAKIKKLNSESSGPVSFMELYNALCKVISSKGHRRGAQMGVLRIDHPDIEEFIRAKHNEDRLTGFNMSIAVTDAFMQAVVGGDTRFDLCFNGEVVKMVNPQVIWEMIMRSTWDWAEPGVIFIDQINRMNNLWFCERIATTNPCAEQPLPPDGSCLLGSFNLTKYIGSTTTASDEAFTFNWDQFEADIPPIVRAIDNVIDQAAYPLRAQQREALSKRRIGLGPTGLANTAEALGYPYGSPGFIAFEREVLTRLRDTTYMASIELAHEKGAFPLYSPRYLEGAFIKTLPEHIRLSIADCGIRNSHLLSGAPAATISLTADNISSGIEPVFAYEADRMVRMDDGIRQVAVQDYGLVNFGTRGKRVQDVTLEEHRDVLLTATALVDSSVSKTCNVPADTPWRDFKQLYIDVWKGGGKGCTTYTVGGQREGILKSADEDQVDEGAACQIDAETGRWECD